MNTETDELSELCGREIDKETRLSIIQESEETGEPVAKIADRWSLPPMFIMTKGQTSFEYNGETYTLESFREKYPYKRIVIIKPREY